jgi:hypothetical protein
VLGKLDVFHVGVVVENLDAATQTVRTGEGEIREGGSARHCRLWWH